MGDRRAGARSRGLKSIPPLWWMGVPAWRSDEISTGPKIYDFWPDAPRGAVRWPSPKEHPLGAGNLSGNVSAKGVAISRTTASQVSRRRHSRNPKLKLCFELEIYGIQAATRQGPDPHGSMREPGPVSFAFSIPKDRPRAEKKKKFVKTIGLKLTVIRDVGVLPATKGGLGEVKP